ncbi:VOC family protein [Nesterenkonia halobia]|uniref:VOC family protein n=1 Tax=Nesterenkonia halobia TaxID=37922 RepID=A0ABP6RF71_9MICC
MSRMIFVNVPTSDLAAADAFYGGLGFTRNEQISDENASSWIIEDSILVMVLRTEFFASFLTGDDTPHLPGDGGPREVLNALSCDSREEVDELLAAAQSHGGSVYRPADSSFPGMYQAAVADPDGHVWELVWMDVESFSEEAGGEAEA